MASSVNLPNFPRRICLEILLQVMCYVISGDGSDGLHGFIFIHGYVIYYPSITNVSKISTF